MAFLSSLSHSSVTQTDFKWQLEQETVHKLRVRSAPCTINPLWILEDNNNEFGNSNNNGDNECETEPVLIELHKDLWLAVHLHLSRLERPHRVRACLLVTWRNERLEVHKISGSLHLGSGPSLSFGGLQPLLLQGRLGCQFPMTISPRHLHKDVGCHLELSHSFCPLSTLESESPNSLGQMLWQQRMATADLTLVSSHNKELRCHKIVLVAQSDVFRVMLIDHAKLTLEENKLFLLDTESSVIDAFLCFAYTDHLRDDLTERSLVQVMMMADKYDLKRLRERVQVRMCNCLDVSNALEFLFVGHLCHADAEFVEFVERFVDDSQCFDDDNEACNAFDTLFPNVANRLRQGIKRDAINARNENKSLALGLD